MKNEEKKLCLINKNADVYGSGEEVLFTGTYKNYNFYGISMGSHPCCYIEIPKDNKYFEMDYDDIPINCHGGLTYGSHHIKFFCEKDDPDRYFIGWDYSHLNDYYRSKLVNFNDYGAKKWTIEELIKETEDAIDSLIDAVNYIQPYNKITIYLDRRIVFCQTNSTLDAYIKAWSRYFNNKLAIDGLISLNEVYSPFEHGKTINGFLNGWIKGEEIKIEYIIRHDDARNVDVAEIIFNAKPFDEE